MPKRRTELRSMQPLVMIEVMTPLAIEVALRVQQELANRHEETDRLRRQRVPTPGLYTRYGDVVPLIQSIDDRLVIMGSGDEMRLLFRAPTAPPPGWKRDFLLLVDGWAKDADPNTAYSQSVEPLPFHGMSQYPYGSGEHFPDDPVHRQYRQQYNTRPALRLIRPLSQLSVRLAR